MLMTILATSIPTTFFGISRTVVAMCGAGILVCLIALWAARTDIAEAKGLDKIVALSNLCFAVPLAVFGALHLSEVGFVLPIVPKYMPWRLFLAYFVGFALLAASLSIATKIQVRWSGVLFAVMMFLFVAMLIIPGVRANPGSRFTWTLVFRESSFGGGGLILAGIAMGDGARGLSRKLITVGRVLVGLAAAVYGVLNFLHPLNVPGVPLEMVMPTWIPGRLLIGWVTGVILVVAGVSILLGKKVRMAATYLGTWIVLLVLMVYGPILIVSLMNPSTGVKIEGINYFADTLLFGGAILALAKATVREETMMAPRS
jgi:putative oxidoreductase